ncbi:MAG: sugar phosphate isomerase/epimerase [Bacteroidetes Order II. Incertae sedis bacterium]|nr:sugar phosphate isomerase/epimerase [Bacteroidetes Order II. bacterium]
MNRRIFLKTSIFSAAMANLATQIAPNDASAKLKRFGVQLYTVRAEMAKSVENTLITVAKLGYKEVEFAGYFNKTPQEIKALLKKNKLSAPAVHIPHTAVEKGDLTKEIEEAQIIGHQFLILPWIPSENLKLSDWKRWADRLNVAGEKCKNAGLKFAYHNHDFEFKSVDNFIPYDLLLNNTQPNLVGFELDLFWITKAGKDPLFYFKKYSGRFPACHVKDMDDQGNMVAVGKGKINFAQIFKQARLAGFKHFFVEHDNPQDPFANIGDSAQYLKNMAL